MRNVGDIGACLDSGVNVGLLVLQETWKKKRGVGQFSIPALSIRKYLLPVSTSHAMAAQKSSFVSTATVIKCNS